MKKLIAVVLALGVSGGLVFAKYSNNDLYSVDIEQAAPASKGVVSLEEAIDQKLEEAILIAQLNREVESEIQVMIDDMDAELESLVVAQLDNIELEL